MKIHTIGTFGYHDEDLVGVILTGTKAEVQEVAKLYSAGGDDFRVERKPDTAPMAKVTP